MSIVWKGGPGHRAPYRTTHVRIPEPIKAAVMEMADDFRRGALIDHPADEKQPGPDVDAAIAILTEALFLNASSGGAIKTEIESAIKSLGGAIPEKDSRGHRKRTTTTTTHTPISQNGRMRSPLGD